MKYSQLDPKRGKVKIPGTESAGEEPLRISPLSGTHLTERRQKYGSMKKPPLSGRASSSFPAMAEAAKSVPAPAEPKASFKKKPKKRPAKAASGSEMQNAAVRRIFESEEQPQPSAAKAEKPRERRTSNISKGYFKEEELFYEDPAVKSAESFQMGDYDLNDGLRGTGRIPADELYTKASTEPYEHPKVRRKRRRNRT